MMSAINSFVLSRSAHHLQAVDKFFSNIRYNPMVRKMKIKKADVGRDELVPDGKVNTLLILGLHYNKHISFTINTEPQEPNNQEVYLLSIR